MAMRYSVAMKQSLATIANQRQSTRPIALRFAPINDGVLEFASRPGSRNMGIGSRPTENATAT